MASQLTLPEDQEQFKLNEVCKVANVQPYMLRFWGTEFPQLEAGKSSTGQRLYSREQVELILEIRRLLFDEGLTIAGARKKVAAMEDDGVVAGKKPVAPKARVKKETKKPEPVAAAEPTIEPEKKKARVTTSSARRKVGKKPAAVKVDKSPSENVQPLLATLKNVREEIDKIVAELKSK